MSNESNTETSTSTTSDLLKGRTVCIDLADWIQTGGSRYTFDLRHLIKDEINEWYSDPDTLFLGAFIMPRSKRHLPPVATPAPEPSAGAKGITKTPNKKKTPPKQQQDKGILVPNATLVLSPEDVEVVYDTLSTLVHNDAAYTRFIAQSSKPIPYMGLKEANTQARAKYPRHLATFPVHTCCTSTKAGEASLNARVKAMTHVSTKKDNHQGVSMLIVFPLTYAMTIDPVPLRLVVIRMLRLALEMLVPIIKNNSGVTNDSAIKLDWSKYVLELGLTCDAGSTEVKFLVRLAFHDTYADHEYDGTCVSFAQFAQMKMGQPDNIPKALDRVTKNTAAPSVAIYHVDLARQSMDVGMAYKKAKAEAAAVKLANAPITAVDDMLVGAHCLAMANSGKSLIADVDTVMNTFKEAHKKNQFLVLKAKVADFVSTVLAIGSETAIDVSERHTVLDALSHELIELTNKLREKTDEEKEAEDNDDSSIEKPVPEVKVLTEQEASTLHHDMTMGAAVVLAAHGPLRRDYKDSALLQRIDALQTQLVALMTCAI